MGKATIVSGGAGLYTISYVLERHRITERLGKIIARMTALDNTEIPAAQSLATEKQIALNTAIAAQDAAIAQYLIDLKIDPLNAAQAKVIEAVWARDVASRALAVKKLERETLRREQVRLQAAPQDETRQAWCADYTQTLTGTVGTCEVPGERKGGQIIIRPANDVATGAAWAATDGEMQPSQASTPEGVFVNLALLPGWQKWDPTYRVGTLSGFNAQNGNLCIVQLDDATSSQRPEGKTMHVCETLELVDVPIEYMGCHEQAFEAGDRVLVKFTGQDRTQPKVVGFESHPKSCISKGFLIPQGKVHKPSGAWVFASHTGYLYGNVDWRGPSSGGTPGKTLSWAGPHGRHFPQAGDPAWDTKVYEAGALKGTAPGNVYGACVRDVSGMLHLTVICCASGHDKVYSRPYDSTDDALYDQATHPNGWRQTGDFQAGTDSYHDADRPWFFNASGTEAQCMRVAKPVQATGAWYRMMYTGDPDYSDQVATPPTAPQLHRLSITLSGLTASFENLGNTYDQVALSRVDLSPNHGVGTPNTLLHVTYTLAGQIVLAVDWVGDTAIFAYQAVDCAEEEDFIGVETFTTDGCSGSWSHIFQSSRLSELIFSQSPASIITMVSGFGLVFTGTNLDCDNRAWALAMSSPCFAERSEIRYLDVRSATVLLKRLRRDYTISGSGGCCPLVDYTAAAPYEETSQDILAHRGSATVIATRTSDGDGTFQYAACVGEFPPLDFANVGQWAANSDSAGRYFSAEWVGEWLWNMYSQAYEERMVPRMPNNGHLIPHFGLGKNWLPYSWEIDPAWYLDCAFGPRYYYDGFLWGSLTGYQPLNVRADQFTGSVCVDASGTLFANFTYLDAEGDTQTYVYLSGADPATLIGAGPYYPIGAA